MNESSNDFHAQINELFDHMVNNLDYKTDEPLEWVFGIESTDIALLEKIGERVPESYGFDIEEEVEHVDDEGNSTMSGPMLSLHRCEALTPEQVKACADEVDALAKEFGLMLADVTAFDPIDEDDFFDWMPIEDAQLRLQHFTESGLEVDSDLPWLFLLFCTAKDDLDALTVALDNEKLGTIESYDEPDEDGNYGLCLFIEGKNNEAELVAMNDRINAIAASNNSEVVGIQFLDQEDFNDVYGDGDENGDSDEDES
ncbi:ribonuclease E inhibitor RraB [Novipirellula galeiformis]|nr:ribonuclease E inhibitor RraB [Novipirellula galeiformis]